MAFDATAAAAVLKTHYVKQRVHDLADLGHPWLSMVKKNTKAGGDGIAQPIKIARAGGGSATFAKAQINYYASNFKRFTLTTKKVYQFAYIENQVIHKMQSDENAFVRAMDEIDSAFERAGDALEWQLFRRSGGAIGRIAAGTNLSAAVITLDDQSDAFNFQVGDKICFSSANGGGALRDAGETVTVTAIDRENSQITVSAVLSTVASIADTDFIFRDGDYDLCIAGLDNWVPRTRTDLGTAFFGVTRSADEDRLAGVFRDANGEPVHETVQRLCATTVKHGGRPDVTWINPEKLSEMVLDVGSKIGIEQTQIKGRATYGFEGISIASAGRTLKMMPATQCPFSALWMLQSDTFTLHSEGEAPMFLDRDGLLARSSTADEYEARIGAYPQLGCSAPGWNGVADLS